MGDDVAAGVLGGENVTGAVIALRQSGRGEVSVHLAPGIGGLIPPSVSAGLKSERIPVFSDMCLDLFDTTLRETR